MDPDLPYSYADIFLRNLRILDEMYIGCVIADAKGRKRPEKKPEDSSTRILNAIKSPGGSPLVLEYFKVILVLCNILIF